MHTLALNGTDMLLYQPELQLCKYVSSKQYYTPFQIFTEYICKAGAAFVPLRRAAAQDVNKSKGEHHIKDMSWSRVYLQCTSRNIICGKYCWVKLNGLFVRVVQIIKLVGRSALVHHEEFAWGLPAAWSQTCTSQTGESNSHLDVQAIGCTIAALFVRIPGLVMIKSINTAEGEGGGGTLWFWFIWMNNLWFFWVKANKRKHKMRLKQLQSVWIWKETKEMWRWGSYQEEGATGCCHSVFDDWRPLCGLTRWQTLKDISKWPCGGVWRRMISLLSSLSVLINWDNKDVSWFSLQMPHSFLFFFLLSNNIKSNRVE